MIAKEWRDARWKFAVAAVVVVLVASLAPILTPYQEIVRLAKHSSYSINEISIGENASANRSGDARTQKVPKPPDNVQQAPKDPVEMAAQEMWALYGVGGSVVLLPLAVLLGAPLVSGEVSGGTISMLLSRPISRTRLLMSKYVVGAAGLFVSAVLGGALVVALAAARGYPLGEIGFVGIALSAVLIWLGSLFVLGVALLASVLVRGVIGSVMASVVALLLVFILPSPFHELLFVGRTCARALTKCCPEAVPATVLVQREPVRRIQPRADLFPDRNGRGGAAAGRGARALQAESLLASGSIHYKSG